MDGYCLSYQEDEQPSDQLIDQIETIFHAAEGERDGDDWVCLVQLKDGRVCKMFAGCDYTGWDCRAGGNVEFFSSLEEMLSPSSLTEKERDRLRLPCASLQSNLPK